jgi:O-antigen/teichoic acid export membrane protein
MSGAPDLRRPAPRPAARPAPSVPAAIRRRLMRGSATVFVGMAAATVLTLVANAILARLLGHGQLGSYFLVFSMVTLGTTIAQMGLDRTVVRLVASSRGIGQRGRALEAIGLIFRIGALVSLGVAALVALGGGRFLAIHVYHSTAVAGVTGLAACWIVVNALLSLTAETFRGMQRFGRATLFSGLAVDVALVVAFGALYLRGAHPSLATAVTVSTAATAATLAIGLLMLRRPVLRMRGGRGMADTAEIVGSSLPLLITSLASFLVGTGVDLWVVGHFRPTPDVALYGAASRLVFFVATPLIIVSQVVPPIIAELHARGERAQLERALRTVATIAGFPAAIVLIAFVAAGPWIMGTVYGGFFRQGATVLAILSCARLMAVVTGSSGVTLTMTGHQRTMMTITVATGVCSLAAEVLLAPRYGITGVAAATCAAQIVQNILQLTFARIRAGIWTHASFSLEPMRELVRG